jgi:predicted nucleic acid-binding protein
VLVLAKRKELMSLVKLLLKNLAISGYFLSDGIVAATLAASGK